MEAICLLRKRIIYPFPNPFPWGLEGGARHLRAPKRAQDGPTGAPESLENPERWRTMVDVGPTSSPTRVQEVSGSPQHGPMLPRSLPKSPPRGKNLEKNLVFFNVFWLASFFFPMGFGGLRMAQMWLMLGPPGSNMAPRWRQDGPMMAQEGAKMAPRGRQEALQRTSGN